MRPATAHTIPVAHGALRPVRSRFRLLPRGLARAGAMMVALAGVALPGSASAIDLGDASVLSRQGQRLQLAIPFGSEPGERVAVTRFQVVSVEALGNGGEAPEASRFTISRPERRNVVYLRSERPVDLERMRIVVSVSGLDGEGTGAAYDIVVPPPHFAPAKDSRIPRSRRR